MLMAIGHKSPTDYTHFKKLILVNLPYKPPSVGLMISILHEKKKPKFQEILKQYAQDHTSSM